MSEPKYRWATPHDWLQEKVRKEKDSAELKLIIFSLLDKLDSDQIQDIFQTEMDHDGYFHPFQRRFGPGYRAHRGEFIVGEGAARTVVPRWIAEIQVDGKWMGIKSEEDTITGMIEGKSAKDGREKAKAKLAEILAKQQEAPHD